MSDTTTPTLDPYTVSRNPDDYTDGQLREALEEAMRTYRTCGGHNLAQRMLTSGDRIIKALEARGVETV